MSLPILHNSNEQAAKVPIGYKCAHHLPDNATEVGVKGKSMHQTATLITVGMLQGMDSSA